MSCRCGAGCARRRDWTRACWRGRRSESPRLSAYGEARPPDEANPPARGCTAGWGQAQATPLGDDLRRAPTRADAGAPQSQHGPTGSGDAGGWLRAQSQGGASRPRDEDPSGTRRTSQALSAANARERTRVWPAHPGSWRQAVLAAGPVAGAWRVVCSVHPVLNLVGGKG
jgi:hypothetical protein